MSSSAKEVTMVPIPQLRRQVVRLAAPICGALIVSALAQLIIAALLGHVGEDALYMRSLFIPVTFLLLAVQEGLDVATQVGFSRLHGSRVRLFGHTDGNRGTVSTDGASALLRRFMSTGVIVLLAVAILVFFAAPVLANVLTVPQSLRPQFVTFARWTVLANVLAIPAVVASAALRGWGRTGASASIALIVAGLQVTTVWLLGLILGFGVLAVPVAIAASAVVGTILSWILLRRARLLPKLAASLPFRRTLSAKMTVRGATGIPSRLAVPTAWSNVSASAAPEVRKLLLGIGLPVGLSYLLLTVTNLIAVWVLSPWGSEVVAGFGGAAAVQTLVVVPAIGLAAAVSIVMNQQWGAGEPWLLSRTLRAGTVVVAGVYVLVGVLVFCLAPTIAKQLSSDQDVAAQAAQYLRIVGPSYSAVGLVLYLLTLLEQLGHGRVAVSLNILYHAAYLSIGGFLARSGGGPLSLYMTMLFANVLGLAVMLPVAIRLIRRRAAALPI
jgi:Na+-driven multidrug efflux pump